MTCERLKWITIEGSGRKSIEVFLGKTQVLMHFRSNSATLASL